MFQPRKSATGPPFPVFTFNTGVLFFFLQFEQIYFAIWRNTFCYLNKYISQFGKIHFVIWTNTFCNLDKYFLKLKKETSFEPRESATRPTFLLSRSCRQQNIANSLQMSLFDIFFFSISPFNSYFLVWF